MVLEDEKWAPHIFRVYPQFIPFETTKNMYFAYELVDQSKQHSFGQSWNEKKLRIWPTRLVRISSGVDNQSTENVALSTNNGNQGHHEEIKHNIPSSYLLIDSW